MAKNLLVLAVSVLGSGTVVQDAGNPGGGSRAFTLLEDTFAIPFALTVGDWTPSFSFGTGTIIRPTVGNAVGHYFLTQNNCVSSVSEPSWPQTLGNTVTDGTCTWVDEGFAAYHQQYYVHEISSSDVNDLGTPSYTFDFTDGSTPLAKAKRRRSSPHGIRTCLNQSVSPCVTAASAIDDHFSGFLRDSEPISVLGNVGLIGGYETGSAFVAAYGSDRNNPTHNASMTDACGDFTNGGLDMAYVLNTGPSTFGAFQGMLQDALAEPIATTDGSTTTFTHVAAQFPISPGSALLTLNGNNTFATDNASGAWVSAVGSGTINYQTGQMSFTFTTAPSAGQNLTTNYQDLGDNIGDILSIIPQVGP